MEGCPDRPASDDPENLGFRPRKMVRWLGPAGLLATAFRVILAGIFGLYSDKREIEAVFPADEESDFSTLSEIWIDFVADVADGFRATYTIASVLAQEELDLEHGGEVHRTNRGRILIMGGDQVYPFATEDAYRNRLTGPYTAALPCTPPGTEPPLLFAIPGNHDWFDGLTTFLRRFCQQRPIGGWKTVQSRSYFAARLPHRWWLMGIDIQFDFYIDEPQLRFFRKVAESIEDGDRVILCTAMPSWVHASLERDKEHRWKVARNLEFFEKEIVRKHGGRVLLALSGDLHHYSRYQAVDGPQQRITSGGGGAYVSPTYMLQDSIEWVDRDEAEHTRYTLEAAYPDRPTSERLAWGSLLAPFTNPSFGVLVAGIYLVFTWMILFALRGANLEHTIKEADFWRLAWGLARNPVSLLSAVALVALTFGFAKAKAPYRRWKKAGRGIPHGLAHLALMIGSMWGATRLTWDGPSFWLGSFTLIGIAGFVLGSLTMGAYLRLFRRAHETETFSSQHIADYKNALRMKIDGDGVITVYPIKVDRVPKFRFVPEGQADEPWFAPEDKPIQPELIEPPITIDPR